MHESQGYLITAAHAVAAHGQSFKLPVTVNGVANVFACNRLGSAGSGRFDIAVLFFLPTRGLVNLACFVSKHDLIDQDGPDSGRSCHVIGFPATSNRDASKEPRLMSRPSFFVEKPELLRWYNAAVDVPFWHSKRVYSEMSGQRLKISRETRGMSGGPIVTYGPEGDAKVLAINTREKGMPTRNELNLHGMEHMWKQKPRIGVGDRLVPYLLELGLC